GPLDVQIKKSDELVGRNSGLDILQAVNYLQNQAMNAFRTYVDQLTYEGLSTRAASDMASKLTTGLFSPIFGQIDPMRLAEMQRATDIAFAYGQRLNEKSRNLRSGGLEKLVVSYPSHGFVIDRKEARSIFIQVDKPAGMLLQW
ncbi:SppA protein, partial [Escherichia coli]